MRISRSHTAHHFEKDFLNLPNPLRSQPVNTADARRLNADKR
jgi:hypothetical protein